MCTNDSVPSEILWRWRSQAKEQAIELGIDPMEVDWLLQEVTTLETLALKIGVPPGQSIAMQLPMTELESLWQQRLGKRIPVQYLVGRVHWRNFVLAVAPGVLIPRPETELLIDLSIAAVVESPNPDRFQQGHWVDVGTGSGAIACALADCFPEALIHGIDCSEIVLSVAQNNAKNLGLSDRMQFHQGYGLEPVSPLQGQLCAMVSNPPYIPRGMIPMLQPEVALHEPQLALDGGEDGLAVIRQLVQEAPRYLQPGGLWLIEMMAGQGDRVVQLLQEQGEYDRITVHPDLAGIDRFVLAYRRSAE